MDDVPEALVYVSEYGFYVWDWQAMKSNGDKANESASKNISEQE